MLCYPDYSKNILNVATSLLSYYGVPTPYPTLPQLDTILMKKTWRHVVLLVFDGMGVGQMNDHLSEEACFRRHKMMTLSSTFPATTAAAMTTLRSGLPPIAHGWLGWSLYFKEFRRVIEVFLNRDYYTRELLDFVSVQDMMPYESIETQIQHATQGQVSGHCLSPFGENPCQHIDDLFNRLKNYCREQGRHFIFCYWTEPDQSMHDLGTKATQVGTILRDLEARFITCAQDAEDTLFIVTADHGQIDKGEQLWLNDYPDMAACVAVPLSLESRAASVFLKPHTRSTFIEAFHASPLAGDFVLLTREEVLTRNLFGEGPVRPQALDFIGDVLLISTTDKELRWRMPGATHSALKGVHAGLTCREMQVPLIVLET